MDRLVADIENEEFDTIPIGGATWIPEVQDDYDGDPIVSNPEFDDTALAVEGFTRYIREGTAPEMLALEGYRASVWTLLAEESARSGREMTLPKEYRL